MPRPCEQYHQLDTKNCRLCFLYETNPHYRKHWGGPPLAIPRSAKPRMSIAEMANKKRH